MTTFEAGSRPTFRERVATAHSICGFREPGGARGSSRGHLPAPHFTMSELSMARQRWQDASGKWVPDMTDPGPDIVHAAESGEFGSEQEHNRILTWLGKRIARYPDARVKRCRAYWGPIAAHAYYFLVKGGVRPPAPKGIAESDWEHALIVAGIFLEYAGDNTLAILVRRSREVAA